MESQRVDILVEKLKELRNKIDNEVAIRLQLDKYQKVIQKLGSFASKCERCYQYFIDLENYIQQLIDSLDHIEEYDFRHHKQKLNHISTHLLKQHKLVSSGFYLSIFMSIGTSLGVVYGLLIVDNIALGIPLGAGIGVAIGVALDADAKKKGKTL
ncbi:hypothetical protein [Ornithinibacillus bavariensis]|uniref:Glycine zipper-like domain-containing protein n=1 Tax=Ornithinibacillus bavariensis TaxID=545502 RepID=A0A919XC89_9BACI|nr:hypothetical protein [Ornithinibacillus bavariensis]GIO28010.1 hypothetical protein J43TS3_26210 [Ornithinibacillus bavariensis]